MSRDLVITVPAWLDPIVAAHANSSLDDGAKMALAIALATENVTRGGGPFGAAVFDGDTCIGAGVNRVLDTGYSIAHAEVIALMAAQQHLAAGNSKGGNQALTLVTSAEPCCQCFGAIVWSGITRLVCGATTEDVEAIGFDEGPKPTDWQGALRSRGIHVIEQVQRTHANAVLRAYQQRGGLIY